MKRYILILTYIQCIYSGYAMPYYDINLDMKHIAIQSSCILGGIATPVISAFLYSQIKQHYHPSPKPHIAHIKCITISGDIQTDNIIDEIKATKLDNTIHGVLLQVDSGGGSAAQSEHLYHEIKLLNDNKPVIALVNNVAASGCYMASCGAEWIIAPSTSTIGSIGVRSDLQHRTVTGLKNGSESGTAQQEIISTGSYTIFNPKSEYAQAYRDRQNIVINELYDTFLSLVAHARDLDKSTHHDWAEGKVFDGEEALQLHLIDEIGTYSQAINALHRHMKQFYETKFDTVKIV